MTIQLASAEDIFEWPDGTQCSREDYEGGGYAHMSDDFLVIPVNDPHYEAKARELWGDR